MAKRPTADGLPWEIRKWLPAELRRRGLEERAQAIAQLVEEFAAAIRSAASKSTSHRDTRLLHCSFCGKSQKEVKKLIAAPRANICDECIMLCNDVLAVEIDCEAGSRGRPPAGGQGARRQRQQPGALSSRSARPPKARR